MEVKNYKDSADVLFREFISPNYEALQQLANAYEKRGFKTWINTYNVCSGEFMLTVKLAGGK